MRTAFYPPHSGRSPPHIPALRICASHAGEGHDAVGSAGVAVYAKEAVGEDPALQETSKLSLDESRRRAVAITGPGQKRFQLVGDDSIEDGLVRPSRNVRARGDASGSDGGVQGPACRTSAMLPRERQKDASRSCGQATLASAESNAVAGRRSSDDAVAARRRQHPLGPVLPGRIARVHERVPEARAEPFREGRGRTNSSRPPLPEGRRVRAPIAGSLRATSCSPSSPGRRRAGGSGKPTSRSCR